MQGASSSSVERDFNGLFRDEAAEAHDNLPVAFGEVAEVYLKVAVDHLLAASINPGHVDVPGTLNDAELCATLEERSNLGTMDHVLAWETGDIGTSSADPFVLDSYYALALPAKGPGHIFASFSAADNDCVELFWCNHRNLLESIEPMNLTVSLDRSKSTVPDLR